MSSNEKQEMITKDDIVTNGSARPLGTLALLCTAQFVGVLNLQIVSIGLPAIQRSLGFSQENLQWVLSANALAFGGFLLLAGRAADIFGHRRLFMIGMALFAIASLGCAFAPSQGVLIVARAVQGLGTAIVTPAALALLTDTFAEGSERNWAFGIWGAAGALGGVISVLLGGVLIDNLGWAWIFFLCVPIAGLACVLAPKVLVERREQTSTHRLDAGGAVIATTGLILLVYSLTQAEQGNFFTFRAGGLLVLALGLLVAFCLLETRVANPLVPLPIFRRRPLTSANLVTVMFTAVANTPIFFFVLYMQQVRGYSSLITGIAFLPTNLAIIIGSVLGTRLTNWMGQKRTMVTGMSLLLVAQLLLSTISLDSNYIRTLLPGLILLGLGLAITQVATTSAGTAHVEIEERGLASGLLNTSIQIGTAVGLVILVTVADAHTATVAHSSYTSAAALTAGFQWAFYTGAGLALLGVLIALFVAREYPPDQEENAATKHPFQASNTQR